MVTVRSFALFNCIYFCYQTVDMDVCSVTKVMAVSLVVRVTIAMVDPQSPAQVRDLDNLFNNFCEIIFCAVL